MKVQVMGEEALTWVVRLVVSVPFTISQTALSHFQTLDHENEYNKTALGLSRFRSSCWKPRPYDLLLGFEPVLLYIPRFMADDSAI